MLSDTRDLLRERRRKVRHNLGGFPLLTPAASILVDCGPRGLGIETGVHLTVGSLTSIGVFVPAGSMELIGRVCWARLVASRARGGGECEPVFRAGIALVEGQSLEGWDRLRAQLVPPFNGTAGRGVAPRRRVVKWRPPRAR